MAPFTYTYGRRYFEKLPKKKQQENKVKDSELRKMGEPPQIR